MNTQVNLVNLTARIKLNMSGVSDTQGENKSWYDRQ